MKAEQQAFVDAVLGRSEPPSRLRKPARGLAVYRNNAQALSAQALAVAFERLRAELGDTAFAALAWTYWRHEPPSGGPGCPAFSWRAPAKPPACPTWRAWTGRYTRPSGQPTRCWTRSPCNVCPTHLPMRFG